jgi:hypothetical protein
MKTSLLAKPKGRGACPSYFLAGCHEAARGGADGYAAAGHELMRHVGREINDGGDLEAKLDELRDLVGAGNDAGVLAWFDREVPRCMALVPRRRRHQFLKGAYAMFEEGQLDW